MRSSILALRRGSSSRSRHSRMSCGQSAPPSAKPWERIRSSSVSSGERAGSGRNLGTEASIFRKISLFCNVKPDCVIENITLPCLYEAPLMLEKSNFSSVVCRELGLDLPAPDLTEWTEMVERIKNRTRDVTIGLVGKYVQLHDAYLSVAEALHHAGYALNAHVDIRWVDSEQITEENVASTLSGLDGILIPGGFGPRGIDGMIHTTDDLGYRETILMQMKNRHAVMTAKDVREFYGAVCAENGSRGIFITLSSFHPEAQKLLDKVDNLTGVNGDKLFEIAKRCRLGLVEKDGRLCIDEELLLNT